MSTINCVSFRGHGSESTGSIAHKNNPTQCPTCGTDCPTCAGTVNFRGGDRFEKKDGPSAGGVILTLAGLTAAGILGLGYASKTGAFSKLKEGWIKNSIGKLEPAAKKCEVWCTTAKTKTTELWTKVKDKFSSKKG